MNKIYDIFEMVLPRNNSKVNKQYLKSHKIRTNKLRQETLENTNEFSIEEYNQLVSDLYKLKITNPNDLEHISKLEFQIKELEKNNNIKNTDKIDAILASLENYYSEIKQEEPLSLDKRRGLYIYEDLSYKLHKLVNTNPINQDKLKKIEQKLDECQEKYHLSELEKIDAKIKALEKYEEQVFRNEENKNIGLNTYKNLIKELNNLKETNLRNIERITQIESKIRKCANQYNLNNLDKISIQLNILEEKY